MKYLTHDNICIFFTLLALACAVICFIRWRLWEKPPVPAKYQIIKTGFGFVPQKFNNTLLRYVPLIDQDKACHTMDGALAVIEDNRQWQAKALVRPEVVKELN